MIPHIEDFTVDGHCSGCGNCCSDFLPMSDWEIAKIHRFIKKHGIKEYRNNAVNGYDMTCPFRDAEKRICTVYDVRPDICRAFMCSHTDEDIANTKMDMHSRKKVVKMRQEFFGNDEQDRMSRALMEIIRNGGLLHRGS